MCLAAGAFGFIGDAGRADLINIEDDRARALLSQTQRNGPAYPRCAARHHRRLAL